MATTPILGTSKHSPTAKKMKSELIKASKTLNLPPFPHHLSHPHPYGFLSWTSTPSLFLLSGNPYHVPRINPHSSLKPRLKTDHLCYEDCTFLRGNLQHTGPNSFCISFFPYQAAKPRHKLSYFFVYSQHHKDYSAPVTPETQKASSTCP